MFPDTRGQTNQDITSFLREKLGVISRAEEVTLLFLDQSESGSSIEGK
jgi:hypothetical protein